jgi:glutathione S-transferase
LPVLEIDGRAIGDSTNIIAALEERWPEPPLYPEDPVDRRRALELEDLFDEQLGPAARLLFTAHVLPDPPLMLGAFVPDLRGAQRLLARLTYPATRRRVVRWFGIDDDSVAAAYQAIAQVGERIRAERAAGEYLVGDRFSVADLTAAALVAPLVAPAQFPYPQPQRGHRRLAPLRDALARAGMLDWVHDMYIRHRGSSAEVPAPAAR